MSLPEIRTRPSSHIDLPVQFSRLRDMAYNLWWSWSPNAQALFERIDPEHWRHYRSPIEVLIDLEPEYWQQLQADPQFVSQYRNLVEEFDDYMFPRRPTWHQQQFGDSSDTIAYFSTEYGWHESLQSYSGGLGILSGDHSKSASDLGLPFVGIGLMYRRGYFRQTVDSEGRQQHFYPHYDITRLPLLPVLDSTGQALRVHVALPGRKVAIQAWRASVGRVPVLLLDCDIPANHPADRAITSILYVNGREMRLCQEIVLGIGGARVLKALGIKPSVWHMNEGHSALLSLERISDVMRHEKQPLDNALAEVSKDAVFTTHTPVPAGNETFEANLIRKYFGGWSSELGFDVERLLELGRNGDDHDNFNLTALALRTSSQTNGVSQLHGTVSTDMWRHLLDPLGRHVQHITNGVHLPSWIGPEMGEVLRRHLGCDFADHLLDDGFATSVLAIPDNEIWQAHTEQKGRLVSLARELCLAQFARHGRSPEVLHAIDRRLDPDTLLIGFARRFATYKRADLLLRDMEQLKAMVGDADRPIQFLFAGKAHPADRPGQDLIRHIFDASNNPDLQGHLLFLENYDIQVGRGMVQGVDVWLNNPKRPLEASGTSGMKVAMNGGLNLSILDGWWCEGYDPEHGWVIGEHSEGDDGELDHQDAVSLYEALRNQIAPCYYRRDENGIPVEWIQRMKLAIGKLSPQFSTRRMVRDYTEKFYKLQSKPSPAVTSSPSI